MKYVRTAGVQPQTGDSMSLEESDQWNRVSDEIGLGH